MYVTLWVETIPLGFRRFGYVIHKFGLVALGRIIQFSFTSIGKKKCILFVVYVDDIVIKEDTQRISDVNSHLQHTFLLKVGPLYYFLGIRLARTKKRISLS